ncbi:hypothetical protein [Streptomyces sp. ALI-76-A]|uniref:hypothetical protein n=1 Tax=Streptomyces sp. ALI-76-A TaxID=3025736 RepID=UPI00256EA051|nr:hypothetical protein [Streptomyces sp. ALI-76-A]MDL5205073.1 hypothetical protein [Streptomyces sp. ALI-76-A]
MKNPEPTSSVPPLSFELRSDHLAGYLRADKIRTDTFVSLVAGWGDPDTRDEAIAALDALAEVVQGPRGEGELDAAVEEIEGVASMDTARIEVDARTARRLFAELSTVATKLWRFNPLSVRMIPGQQDGRRTA